MEVKVLDVNGKETGRKVQLSDSVFAIEQCLKLYFNFYFNTTWQFQFH